MLTLIIRSVIRFQTVMLTFITAMALFALYSLQSAPLDAMPDISDKQIIIYTKWARSAEILESELTKPLVRSLLGSSGIKSIRATSHLGFSFIYILLQDKEQYDQVKQRVLDQISTLRSQLPGDASIKLGSNASSMGWIYQYALIDRTGIHDLREMRLLNESKIKFALQAVSGIAEVATVGGLERQIEFKIFPPLLRQAGISLTELVTAIQNTFQQVGGRTIELTNRDYHLRAVMDYRDLDKLQYLLIGETPDGNPITLSDIGYFQVGYDVRRGIADLNGEGEVVGAIVIMEQGQNVLTVSRALTDKLQSIRHSLPDGVEIITTYDRSTLIKATLYNFLTALGYELLVVILVIIWALRNGRAAVAPVLVILLGCLYTIASLIFVGQTINLLSLAGLAIAIGEMADATIVIVENCAVELAKRRGLNPRERVDIIIRATSRMMRPLLFSLLIILASFLPVFFIDPQDGHLFDSLVFSKTFAMGFSTFLTLFFLPAIVVWVFKQKTSLILPSMKVSLREGQLLRLYRKLLLASIRHRYIFVGFSVILLVFTVLLMSNFKRDYMPEMDEGSVLYMPTTLPGLPIREAGWILQQMDRKLKEFPEVQRVFGKLGRADTATDPAPLTMIEITVLLKPRSQWRKGMNKKNLLDEMDKALRIIGYVNSWTQPIAGRLIMQNTGIQTIVGIKVKGDKISVIENISKNIESLLRRFPGTASVVYERIAGGYYVDIQNDLERLAKHKVKLDEAMSTVRYAIGGENVVSIRQVDNSVVPLSIQYSPEYVDTLEKVRNTPVQTINGNTVPLKIIANVTVQKMPEMLRNDNGMLAAYIYINPQGMTGTDYVEKAKQYLTENLNLPTGYILEWTGMYQYAEETQARLQWVLPLTVVIMFILLMMVFKTVGLSIVVLLSAPFALVGGVILQWMLGYAMTTAVVIGYIAVFAVAIQTGIIMIEFIRDALGNRVSGETYEEAVITGSVTRLRPKLMTVATTVLGLIPIVLVTGSGMDITKPIAAPSIGGMLSSVIYVLFLIPCLFVIRDDFRKPLKRTDNT